MEAGRWHQSISFIKNSPVFLAETVIYIVVLALIIYFGVFSYQNYRKESIENEQKQLLTMAQTIGISLVNYVDAELDSIDMYFTALEFDSHGNEDDDAFIKSATEAYWKHNENLYDAVACFDAEGNLIDQKGSMDVSENWIPEEKAATICGKKICSDGWYQMFVSRKVTCGRKQYTVIFAMNLNEIYQMIVAPVQIGRGGYSVVKDKNLSIIMHHAADQIGMDAIYDRDKRYPQLDLTDLGKWMEMQRIQPEGYRLLETYVWDDPQLSPIRRIVAYTTIYVRGESWIVNSTLPYEELQKPLQVMLFRLMGMCLLLIGLISGTMIILTRNLVRSEGQKKEITYLREINEGMELLRHKEEEIQHYQRVQSIGQMSSHIAHEFNNYLTPVMVYGELLEGDENISPENQELVKGILKSANQAAGLSRKLLDFSRMDSSVTLTVIDLAKDVKEASDIIRQLTPKNIEFHVELPEEPCPVMGRAGMVEHILMNLCNNAFHAMEKDGGKLEIRLEYCGGKAELSVSDTGCGIPKDAMDKIFEPFYTTKRSGKGTGLGLSVIRNIMTAVGGQIHIESEVGKGTCFYLEFPVKSGIADVEPAETRVVFRKNPAANPAAKSVKKERNKQQETPDVVGFDTELKERTGQDRMKAHKKKKQQKIVIVDDDETILDSMSALLRQNGYAVECYNHPAAVISKIQNKKDYCDTILTDYSMPSMNGIELAELIRKLNPEIHLILMSGMEDVRFEWYLKNRIIDQFILKTELAEKLPEVIEE